MCAMTIVERTPRGAAVGRAVLLALLAAVTAGVAYETTVALDLIMIRANDADGDRVLLLAFVALLGGGVLFLVAGVVTPIREALSVRLVRLVDVAAVCFVVARWYSYDPYYLPTLRRMSEGGLLTGWWLLVLIAYTAGVVISFRGSRCTGIVLSGVLVWVCMLSAFFAALGH